MPKFAESAHSAAPPEEVWKLLYDPARFPQWWAGVGSVEPSTEDGSTYTMYPDGYPDFPMPQQLRSDRGSGNVTISCLVSDLLFEWRLSAVDGGTAIEVDVDIPDSEAHRLDTQRQVIRRSVRALADLAAREAR
ncbi:SRPBCC family protein [Actinokineospora sp. HUAS TT18]|uniref:SRPBCC family protein n=1 Tax=Actinokineospora sp. HUAS TT18 TaxID=3447451 RepID=UPI003F51FD5F